MTEKAKTPIEKILARRYPVPSGSSGWWMFDSKGDCRDSCPSYVCLGQAKQSGIRSPQIDYWVVACKKYMSSSIAKLQRTDEGKKAFKDAQIAFANYMANESIFADAHLYKDAFAIVKRQIMLLSGDFPTNFIGGAAQAMRTTWYSTDRVWTWYRLLEHTGPDEAYFLSHVFKYTHEDEIRWAYSSSDEMQIFSRRHFQRGALENWLSRKTPGASKTPFKRSTNFGGIRNLFDPKRQGAEFFLQPSNEERGGPSNRLARVTKPVVRTDIIGKFIEDNKLGDLITWRKSA